jgi:hypothetical protein
LYAAFDEMSAALQEREAALDRTVIQSPVTRTSRVQGPPRQP